MIRSNLERKTIIAFRYSYPIKIWIRVYTTERMYTEFEIYPRFEKSKHSFAPKTYLRACSILKEYRYSSRGLSHYHMRKLTSKNLAMIPAWILRHEPIK